jgi:hypothetical protein
MQLCGIFLSERIYEVSENRWVSDPWKIQDADPKGRPKSLEYSPVALENEAVFSFGNCVGGRGATYVTHGQPNEVWVDR